MAAVQIHPEMKWKSDLNPESPVSPFFNPLGLRDSPFFRNRGWSSSKRCPSILYMVESGNDFQGWTYWKLIFQTSIFGSPAINLAGNRFLFSPSLGISYFGEFENFVLVRHILYMFTFTRRVDRLCLEHSLEKSLVWTASLLRKGYCIYASM